jgi:hypothetical protein
MLQLSFARRQSIANIPQRLRVPQLAEQHRHELSPTAKSAAMSLGLMLPNRILKLYPWEQTPTAERKCCILDSWRNSPSVELACWASFNLTESFRLFFAKI